MQARILSQTHSDNGYFSTKRSLKLPSSSSSSSKASNMSSSASTTVTTMTALDQVRARSNSGPRNSPRTRVHFDIQEATPEFYGSRWLDVLSLYSGSSSFEVAIAALCSLALFVAVGQGFFEGPHLGVILVGVLFVASVVHWALLYLFSGSQAPKNDTPLSRIY